MKGFRKSTRIAYWVLRALAISSALLLFSIIGIVALQPASHATGLAITLPPTTSATSSPADMTTPTDTPTPTNTPVPTPTNTPTPPTQPTPTPKPPTPTPTPTKTTMPTATPALTANTPVVPPTATAAAVGPAAPLPTPLPKGTPQVTPSPSPSGSPIASPGTTPIPSSTNGGSGNSSTTPQNSNGGMMATLKPLIGPIAGVSTALLLGSAGMLGLMVWRRRKTAPGAVPSFALGSGIWANAQASQAAQSTELAPAQNRPMFPSAMQGIVQYSPLLGALNTSQLDAPVAPPASDFRPLSIDYPQIMEVHTDKTPVPVTPATLQSLSPIQSAKFQPALQLASAQDTSRAATEVGPNSGSIRTPFSSEQQNTPITYEFPQPDPLMENIMQQAQMGIFALPGKGA